MSSGLMWEMTYSSCIGKISFAISFMGNGILSLDTPQAYNPVFNLPTTLKFSCRLSWGPQRLCHKLRNVTYSSEKPAAYSNRGNITDGLIQMMGIIQVNSAVRQPFWFPESKLSFSFFVVPAYCASWPGGG